MAMSAIDSNGRSRDGLSCAINSNCCPRLFLQPFPGRTWRIQNDKRTARPSETMVNTVLQTTGAHDGLK
jgi:hypothetical protein